MLNKEIGNANGPNKTVFLELRQSVPRCVPVLNDVLRAIGQSVNAYKHELINDLENCLIRTHLANESRTCQYNQFEDSSGTVEPASRNQLQFCNQLMELQQKGIAICSQQISAFLITKFRRNKNVIPGQIMIWQQLLESFAEISFVVVHVSGVKETITSCQSFIDDFLRLFSATN